MLAKNQWILKKSIPSIKTKIEQNLALKHILRECRKIHNIRRLLFGAPGDILKIPGELHIKKVFDLIKDVSKEERRAACFSC